MLSVSRALIMCVASVEDTLGDHLLYTTTTSLYLFIYLLREVKVRAVTDVAYEARPTRKLRKECLK